MLVVGASLRSKKGKFLHPRTPARSLSATARSQQVSGASSSGPTPVPLEGASPTDASGRRPWRAERRCLLQARRRQRVARLTSCRL